VRTLAGILITLALLAPSAAVAEFEQDVKAAFLFKFLSYIEWPGSALGNPENPLVIGVLGAEEVCASLKQIVQGRQAQGRPIDVRCLKEGKSVAGVHMLFVGKPDAEQLRDLSKQSGVVLVSEVKDALDRGASINFVRVGENVRFEVALDAAARSGLKISSRMLTVALRVKGGPS
jgi:hypothetical protein